MFKGDKVNFSTYLDKINIHRKTELLKIDLVRNGLSPNEVIERFSDYIGDFFNDFMSCIVLWERIEEVNKY